MRQPERESPEGDKALASADGLVLLDVVRDPIVACDANHRIVLWNFAAEATYGFTPAEALGKRPAQLLRTRFPIPPAEIEDAVRDTGSWAGTVVHRTKGDLDLTVETRWVARLDDAGEFAGILAIDRDVSARLEVAAARAEESESARVDHASLSEKLDRTQRLESVGQLAGGIAHDFNNMLGVIINYAAFVSRELSELESASGDPRWTSMRGDIAEIELAADRAARLTRQLLAFSRQEGVRPVALDLNETIGGLEELLRRTVGEHVELTTTLAPDLHPILADPAQLQQVLLDVVVNSRDAMPSGGTLNIDTANVEVDAAYASLRPELVPGPYVRLRVVDNGEGMTPEVVARAFDPFFTTKPVGLGTGLGLASVYGIVTRMGGRAQLYSEPDLGTTFSALLPATDTAPVPVKPMPPIADSTGTETVLLVEDEDALRAAAKRILAGAGYTVLTAANGREALELAKAHPDPIDLLLTDVVMPEMLGHRLAANLLLLRPSLRVLYMSGFAEPFLDRSMHVEDADLIEKPFTAPALLARVRRALG